MKIVMRRKETTGANNDCCHGRRFVRHPGLSEEVTVVAVRLGMHEIQPLDVTAPRMSFSLCVAALNKSAKAEEALSEFRVLYFDEQLMIGASVGPVLLSVTRL